MENKEDKIVNEPSAVYQASFGYAEMELLRDGLNRTYKERFEFATRLYKIQKTMSKASISNHPFLEK